MKMVLNLMVGMISQLSVTDSWTHGTFHVTEVNRFGWSSLAQYSDFTVWLSGLKHSRGGLFGINKVGTLTKVDVVFSSTFTVHLVDKKAGNWF